MKYATEVINLMGCFPGRRFKMRHIINHVSPGANPRQRAVIRTGLWRVLAALEESGQVESSRATAVKGEHVEYWWKSITSGASKPFQEPSQYAGTIAP